MFRKIGQVIEAQLKHASTQKLPDSLQQAFKTAEGEIQKDVDIMLNRHTAQGPRASGRQGNSVSKDRLHQALTHHYNALEKAWGAEPIIEPQARAEAVKTADTLFVEDVADDEVDFDQLMMLAAS